MIGKRIAELRIARGLTPEGLAQLAGMTQPGINLIENGQRWPRSATLDKLAGALNCTVADLLMPVGSSIPPKAAPVPADAQLEAVA